MRTSQLLPQARTSALFADLFGQRLTPGTRATTQQACAAALAEVEAAIKVGVPAAAVANFDETGLSVAGKRHWLHVVSTPHLTPYATPPKRGTAATTESGILPNFRGLAVPDAWAPYGQMDCLHALCNAPHLRALTALVEQGNQAWAQEMKDLLRVIKRTVEAAPATGAQGLPATTHEAFIARYQALVTDGLTKTIRRRWPCRVRRAARNKAQRAICCCACRNGRKKYCGL